MSEVVRFGVSLEKELLDKFDRLIKEKKYSNRSEAIRDLIRENLVKREWVDGKEVAGAITLVFDHHKRDLVNILTDIQHDFYRIIISSQHIHLDHSNCLEIIVVRGKPTEVRGLANKLKSNRGVKYGALSIATTGKELV
ncbi:MAG: nickel-responsive transcriptional regulator NikR [Candidatus Infernicultor aquiphilus]|uniref:Putative nickel-responsive regulator n=1 Tax=Candidatus Infernicultor aquiphilus TaxID=1805029 RepID=A0A2M7PRP9_9BACT|nr:MAG: nickel-responsive transcriptional regulator NikR [Candidatus Atribacteria bacterium CG17_big_fil_post_rev_8_21_14_2_50_34_11]PIX33390.1 MAG: nickel-responsive transcriptional regulator NikR [Candidatus Atribacteria bacterium CG_4_8_14_3_um_filter_34_18]PIY33225.1 MAG: nickel-responsive transcriptional regulator NikR [Candidatus Atribacteria bacterium CG_4_10_14_3_um_filter_34_13]PJB57534.1 MAG: nickel-responsive transcriptional regulator NikR [Candidatus Atribacteria bacterium CG_4_9_14_